MKACISVKKKWWYSLAVFGVCVAATLRLCDEDQAVDWVLKHAVILEASLG